MSDIMLRAAKPSDVPFLTSTWLKSYRDAPAVRGVPNRVYYYYHHKVLEALLTRCTVMVACYDHTPDQILGYVCAELFDSALVVHYVYTKQTFRGFGVARKLVKHLIDAEKPPAVLYTHKTKDVFPIERKMKGEGWIFHPYMLWVSLPEKWEDEESEGS